MWEVRYTDISPSVIEPLIMLSPNPYQGSNKFDNPHIYLFKSLKCVLMSVFPVDIEKWGFAPEPYHDVRND